MDDDFNTPLALRNLHELSKSAQSYIKENPKRLVLSKTLNTILGLEGVLGVLEEEEKTEFERKNLIEEILKLRERYRKRGEYEVADSIRKAVEEGGIMIEDTKRGPRWKSSE